MPAYLIPNPASLDPQPCANRIGGEPSAECPEATAGCLTIGLINNMPDGALEATERHFLSLLNSASGDISIRLSLYSLPGIERNGFGTDHIGKFYSSTENLLNTQLDALIVTGREPLTPNLRDEPYWESFTRVLEWARENTYSTVWSCLAAHAAILHMDGISRIKSNHKHCGVFDCARLLDHSLIDGTPARFKLPHSRWNGVSEDELTACGYNVLTRADGVGVDTFVKQDKSLFVFFQGHPEYESNTLLHEYRRDVGRYLIGETGTYPLMPRSYFGDDTVGALRALQQEATTGPPEELLAKVSDILESASVENTWNSTAVGIYRNWLRYISAQKELRLQEDEITAETRRTGNGPEIADSIPVLAAARVRSSSTVLATDY